MEKAIKRPNLQEEETQPAKYNKLAPPTIRELLERRKDLVDPMMFTNWLIISPVKPLKKSRCLLEMENMDGGSS